MKELRSMTSCYRERKRGLFKGKTKYQRYLTMNQAGMISYEHLSLRTFKFGDDL